MVRVKRVCPTQEGARITFDIVWDTEGSDVPDLAQVHDVIADHLTRIVEDLDDLDGLLVENVHEDSQESLTVVPLEITEYYYPTWEDEENEG